MTEGDGPPVFLPEPSRPSATPPAAEPPEPAPEPEHPAPPAPGSGRRLDEVPRRRGIPSPVLAFILAVTLMISIKEGSLFPVLIGAAFFLFLRRRAQR